MTGDDFISTEKRYAVLIDGDNISAKYLHTIFDEITKKGVTTYKRIYGDWTSPNLVKWKDILLEYSVTPMQQYSYTVGKSSTDSAMIIDAMDILYSGKVEGFCLATSDSDFTKLASRLRESGMDVIGMGEEKTPRPFVKACDEFKFIDKIAKSAESGEHKQVQKNTGTAKSVPIDTKKPSDNAQTDYDTICSTIISLIIDSSDDEGYMPVSDVGNIISKRYADFDVRNFGYKKMVPFLESFGCFEIKKIPDRDNKKHPSAMIAYVRLMPNRR